jgi:hypothetical protein
MRWASSIAVVFWLVVCGLGAQGQSFRAGVSKADITPPIGYEMWGYTNRPAGAKGVLDNLYARVLVLDDGRKSVAVVTLDLGRTFGRQQMDWVRAKARQSSNVADVVFIASHTHAGPNIDESYPDGQVPAWERSALEAILKAIDEARSILAPARIGTGWGICYIGHNRRLVRSDGSIKMLWRNSTATPTGTVDPTVGVIRIDSARGEPIAILVNYACHPVVLGFDNVMYSADYPGAMARLVEQSWNGTPLCFFLQGACGDINPFMDKTPVEEGAFGQVRRVGETLGREVARVSRQIYTREPATPRIEVNVEEMAFRNRWDLDKLRAALDQQFPAALASRYRRYLVDPIIAPVTTLVINNEIGLVGMPGEPFVSFQMELRQRAPLRDTFFCGYTNGYLGYFPTIKDAVVGGYGANGIVTRIEVGAGERMLDKGIINLLYLLGRLKDKPAN